MKIFDYYYYCFFSFFKKRKDDEPHLSALLWTIMLEWHVVMTIWGLFVWLTGFPFKERLTNYSYIPFAIIVFGLGFLRYKNQERISKLIERWEKQQKRERRSKKLFALLFGIFVFIIFIFFAELNNKQQWAASIMNSIF